MEKISTKTVLKMVMTFACGIGAALILGACTTDATTGETTFAPLEVLKSAASSVSNIPDESKAEVLEGLAALLAATGVGAVAVPAVKMGASYFRNKSKNTSAATEEVADVEKVEDDTLNG